jgi:hypothetical protein
MNGTLISSWAHLRSLYSAFFKAVGTHAGARLGASGIASGIARGTGCEDRTRPIKDAGLDFESIQAYTERLDAASGLAPERVGAATAVSKDARAARAPGFRTARGHGCAR